MKLKSSCKYFDKRIIYLGSGIPLARIGCHNYDHIYVWNNSFDSWLNFNNISRLLRTEFSKAKANT